MTGVLSAFIILLLLGVLITVHELGHFLAARLCGIRVREFAIGMGPAFYKKQKTDENGEPAGTKFSLRALPIGGFCDLGEDEASDDPAHFRNKRLWQKIFVLISGALMNFLLGFVFYLILFGVLGYRDVPVVSWTDPSFPYQQIQAGDRFVAINGNRVSSTRDSRLFLSLDADEPYTFELERDGVPYTVAGVTRQLTNSAGEKIFGFQVGAYEEIGALGVIGTAAGETFSSVRMVWVSLGMLISGEAKVTDMAGPVGMGGMVNGILSQEGATLGVTALNILDLAGMVAVNLAVFNLLPIPALDGGRILFLFISAFLVLVRKKPLSEKVEGYIHGGTMLLLFGLMIFIFFNDIRRLIGL
ncbi:MAG: site-2 protease family protein [Oscillospiraceae bacterium]|nr:site-2 protease family protein [Oscillospiraceae bacterium]